MAMMTAAIRFLSMRITSGEKIYLRSRLTSEALPDSLLYYLCEKERN